VKSGSNTIAVVAPSGSPNQTVAAGIAVQIEDVLKASGVPPKSIDYRVYHAASDETNAPIRVAAAPPMQFTLGKDPGPIPNALDRNIQQLIQDAASMRDAGRIDQALVAYQDIRTRNPKLTSINLVIGDLYRRKAMQETDSAARQNLYRQALDAYDQMLKSDATNERALAESKAIRAATRNE